MQKELIEFRQTYAEVAASQKRLEKQRIQAEGLTQEWLKRAKLALENGDEVAARAALERKNQQEELATSLANQIQSQSQAVSNLYSKMQEVGPLNVVVICDANLKCA
jgi:phage shock protein A